MSARNKHALDLLLTPMKKASSQGPSESTLLLEAYNLGKKHSRYPSYDNVGAIVQRVGKTIGEGAPTFLPGWNLTNEQLLTHKYDSLLIHAVTSAINRLVLEIKDVRNSTIYCPILPDSKAAQFILPLGVKKYVYDERAVEQITLNEPNLFHNAFSLFKKASVTLVPIKPRYEHTFIFRGIKYKLE